MCTEHVQGSMDVYRACTGQHGCVQSMYRAAWMFTEHVQGSMDVYRACTGQHGCVQSMYRAAWMFTEHGWPLHAVDLPSSRLSQTEPLDKGGLDQVCGIDLRKSTPPFFQLSVAGTESVTSFISFLSSSITLQKSCGDGEMARGTGGGCRWEFLVTTLHVWRP